MTTDAYMDLECLHDYFLCKFLVDETFHSISMFPGRTLDRQYIQNILAAHRVLTFNGNHYDGPMLSVALLPDVGTDYMKQLNDRIIVGGLKSWDLYKMFGLPGCSIPDHVDLFEVAPGVNIGLKMYMGRCHAPKMQDLPFDPNYRPDAAGRFETNAYCGNDLVGTKLLAADCKDRLALRDAMSAAYKVDLRSKSDAQIAEAVIKAQLSFYPNKRVIHHGYEFRYLAPPYLRFITPQLQHLLTEIQTLPFVVTDKEEALEMFGDATGIRTGVQIPPSLKGRDIHIGSSKYRMGIGGLHSQESSVNYVSDADHVIWDVDVTSYYPSLIRTMGMTPEQLGPEFLTIYDGVYNKRLTAKGEAAKLYELGLLGQEYTDLQTESDGLKIVLNGTFGKLFSKWSILYAPEFGIRTTITGQLALLMLIEMIEAMECASVVSANTDGIVLKIRRGMEQMVRGTIKWWESATGLGMEETHYKGIWMRDVNNYIAITDKGKVKRKGVFGQSGVLNNKAPNQDICADAVVNYLQKGTPLEFTIMGCKDIRKFVVVRQCKGGAVDLPTGVAIDDGKYLGKAIRWYYGQRPGYIGQKGTGNKVAGSDWATPVMELPASMPHDINHQHYINVAIEMLANIGVRYE